MIRFGICNELFEGWSHADVCQLIAEIGYQGIELAPFTLGADPTGLVTSRRREIRSTVEDAGLETIGLHWLLARTEGLHLTSPDPEVRRKTGDYLIALAELSRDLGGRRMVFGSPKQRDILTGLDASMATGYALEVFERIMPVIGELDIDLCLEPLSPSDTNFLNTCDQAMAVIRQVNHPRFKLQLDVKAQSSETTATVPDLIRRHSHAAGHFHAQDVNLRGPGMGDVDFEPIVKALVESRYDRWISVEVFDFSPGAEVTARSSLTCLTKALSLALDIESKG